MTPSDPWHRAGLDAFAHADGHAREGDDPGLRQALLGFDIAIEATISGFLRRGPGIESSSALAIAARAPKATFWSKATWMVEEGSDSEFGFTASQINLIRSFRNEIQHGGDWWVPDEGLVAVASEAASAVLNSLVGEGSAAPFALAFEPVFAQVDPEPIRHDSSSRRRILTAAWGLAQQIDPAAEGVHFRHLALRLVESGYDFGRKDAARVVYDALNRGHDLFQRVEGASGVFAWTSPDPRDFRTGTRGQNLADACVAVLLATDLDRSGLSYSRDVVPILLRWGVQIRGHDIGATVNEAMRKDSRFERVPGRPGVYRLRAGPTP